MNADFERIVAELEAAAEKLRDGDPSPGDAAALVERCAELAAQAGTALEGEARAARSEAPGQERLL